jgi:hypothetical protein
LRTEPTIPHRPVPPAPLEESLTEKCLPPTKRATDVDGLMPRPPIPGERGVNAASIIVHVVAVLGAVVLCGVIEASKGRDGAPLYVLGAVSLLGVGIALELNRQPIRQAIGIGIVAVFALIGAGSLVLLALAILMFVICIVARA